MTIAFVRLVLELSRPLRQELMRKRLEVARGRSPKLEQSFDDIRVFCPRRSTRPSARCPRPRRRAPDGERSLFDPLFRTLAREKRQCVSAAVRAPRRHRAQHARELYAAAVFSRRSPRRRSRASSPSWSPRTSAGSTTARRRGARWRGIGCSARHAPALALVAPLEAAESQAGGAARGGLSAEPRAPRVAIAKRRRRRQHQQRRTAISDAHSAACVRPRRGIARAPSRPSGVASSASRNAAASAKRASRSFCSARKMTALERLARCAARAPPAAAESAPRHAASAASRRFRRRRTA